MKTVKDLLDRLMARDVDAAMLQLDDHFEGDRRAADTIIWSPEGE